ncbi:TauD/TfdA family dioxygenase [Myxococcota bacterium]|nr:TauD/TfdA family dioxygenase [Myxococcota bacterium]
MTQANTAPLGFEVEPLDSALGARIHGIDLRTPLTSEVSQGLRDTLYEYQVLFFRDQPLSDQQHLALAQNFGTPNLYPVNEMLGIHEPLEFVEDGPGKKPVAAAWHTDVTWLQDPPKIGILAAQIMPAEGGDTMWCSLYSVYDALSREMRERIQNLTVAHAAGPGFVELVIKRFGDEFVARFEELYGSGSRHPLIRNHEVVGRPLVYLAGGFMDHIEGQDIDSGRRLLKELMSIADDPVHQIRWKWAVDDLAIWDERSTMHRVDTSHWPEPRRMRRCTIS